MERRPSAPFAAAIDSLSRWSPDVIQEASKILLQCVSKQLDMETTKSHLLSIAGLKAEEVSILIQQIGPLVLEKLRASSVAAEPRTFMSNGTVSHMAVHPTHVAMSRHEQLSDSEQEDGNLGEASSERFRLSPSDRAKLDYIKEVYNILQHAEAIALTKGFASGQLSFAEVVQSLPAAFIRAPHLIERFSCLTNHSGQRQILSRLATAVGQLSTCITQIPAPLRKQACHEVAALVAHQTFPSRTSSTREFTFYACQRAVPAGTNLPRLQGPPQLTLEGQSQARQDFPSSQRNNYMSGSSTHNVPNGTHNAASNSMLDSDARPAHDATQNSHSIEPSASHATSSGDGPSYTRRPPSYEPPLCSDRDALGDSVLNDYYHCAGSGSEGSSQDNIRNPNQEALFRLEEDALCVDILIGRAQSCVRVLGEIGYRLELLSSHQFVDMQNTKGDRIRARTPSEVINASLLAIHLDTFRVIAKNRTSMVIADPMTHFHADPHKFIQEMTRLCMFQADEHVRIRRCFGKLWKHVFAHQYVQSLDHRVYRMKNDDKHLLSPKAILSHLNLQYHEALVCGRDASLDFQQVLDFTHFRYNLLPHLTHSKSQRYQWEHQYNSDPSFDIPTHGGGGHARTLPPNLPPTTDSDTRHMLESNLLTLIEAGCSKMLNPADNQETVAWMRDTFSLLFSFPQSPQWIATDPSKSYPTQRMLFGPTHLYVILRMYHTLHERLRLAFWLSRHFESKCWQFSDTPPPQAPPLSDVPEPSPLFPSFVTCEPSPDHHRPTAPPTSPDFPTNPPTPFYELSTLYLDSHPDYIAQWESESSPIARLTRAGAISSSGLLLGGAPPTPNTQLLGAILRQAAQLRNTPMSTSYRPNYAAQMPPCMAETASEADEIASLPPLQDDALEVPTEQKFDSFLTLLKSVLKGSLEASNYELQLMKLLGPEAYPLYSLPRLIANMITQIRGMMTLPGRQLWYQLWGEYMQTMVADPPKDLSSLRLLASRYLEQAIAISSDHKFMEFRISSQGTISYKVHQRARPAKGGRRNREPSPVTHEAYIKSWNSPKLDGVDITNRRIFLKRNISSQLPEEVKLEPIVGRAPSWTLAQAYQHTASTVISGPGVHASLDPVTSKMIREAFSTDWMVRKSRNTSSSPARRVPNPKSLLHTITSRLAKNSPPVRMTPFGETAEAKQLLERVHALVESELRRPDFVFVEAPVVETVSSRVHKRKSKVSARKENDSNGADSDGDEAENGSDDVSPEGVSEADSSLPDAAPYQMQID